MGLYDFYEKRIFPRFLDLGMRPLEPYRGEAIAGARGRVLEIGFGTGLNLPHYPPAVEHLTAIDPMDAVRKKVRARMDAVSFPVERYGLAADGGLPFEDERFDSVTVTWTLCTIVDPMAALREMRRVACRGAPLLFIEHGRSDDPSVARWQDRLNPIQKLIGCGCNLNRRIDSLIESAGYRIETLDRFDAARVPRTHGHLYRGTAIA